LLRAATRTVECISFEDLKKWKIVNLPAVIDEAVMVVVDKTGTILYTSGYSKVLGIDDKRMFNRKLTKVEPCANTLKMLKMEQPSMSIGSNVLPSLSHLKVEGAVLPLFTEDEKMVGGMTVFIPWNRTDLIGQLHEQLHMSHIRVNLGDILNDEGIHLKNNREMIGVSEAYRKTIKLALYAARSEFDVLITGETGVGKELIAEFINLVSSRRYGPFINVNCAAVPESLLESELFGYEAGAFTGASKFGKQGKFELASGGTIFLDEIGEMSLAMQAKLLRVLQEREIERVGGTKTRNVDIRVIAATNRNLEEMVEKGQFRQDLYYRLNVVPIYVPPLRKRKEDIIKISNYLSDKIEHKTGIRLIFSRELETYLLKYKWPGNVRELENLLKFSSVLALEKGQDAYEIKLDDLAFRMNLKEEFDEDKGDSESLIIKAGTPLRDLYGEVEKKAIMINLNYCNMNKTKASEILGLTRQSLYQKMKHYSINVK